jgi:hypothetical protein
MFTGVQTRLFLDVAISFATLLWAVPLARAARRRSRRAPRPGLLPRLTSGPFWLAALGGVASAVAEIARSNALAVVGIAMFMYGVVLFFVCAVLRARAESVSVARAGAHATKDALRFVFYLMP